MQIIRDLDSFKPDKSPHPRVMTAGVFDGVHRGHQGLIQRVREQAGADGTGIVFTFSNHPLSVLAPAYVPRFLMSHRRKLEIFEKMGVDLTIAPEFTTAFADQSPERFIDKVLIGQFAIDKLIVGFDFRFGKDGLGTNQWLSEIARHKGFEVEILPPVFEEEWTISSTRIREFVNDGRMKEAMKMLGRPYELEGPVIHGFGRGRKLGFPTANLDFDTKFALPGSGVYAVFAALPDTGDVYGGMMNVGSSPTFSGTEYRPEVFLFDYENGSLYDKTMRIYFIERIREERKFPSADALVERIRVDEKLARAILENEKNRDLMI
ncbi:MAG: bifunctional riboflavin kinase/FAD synthetase [Candidatus Sumerlaeia bacterium]